MQLTRGQRVKITDLIPAGQSFTLKLDIQAPDLNIKYACFGLNNDGQLTDDKYITFFNQIATPCGAVQLQASESFFITLERLPATVTRLMIIAALADAGTMAQIQQGCVSILVAEREVSKFNFNGTDFSAERALILLEIYRKDNIWRVCALGQGFNGGLTALVTNFGGKLAVETMLSCAPQANPVNLNKITLDKRGTSLSLDKKPANDYGEILINLNWTARSGKSSKGIDLDLGCLFELTSGVKGAVQALGNIFGDLKKPPYIALDGDDRTGASTAGENLRINGTNWDKIQRVLVYAFIYEGAPNWAEANAYILIKAPQQSEIKVQLDSARTELSMCAIALLENQADSVKITKLVEYYRGHREVDRAHHWGLQWVRGSKDD